MIALTEAERAMLKELQSRESLMERDLAGGAFPSLRDKGYVEIDEEESTRNFVFWAISDAGRAALVDAAVDERFKPFEEFLDEEEYLRTIAEDATVKLIAIVRDLAAEVERLKMGGTP